MDCGFRNNFNFIAKNQTNLNTDNEEEKKITKAFCFAIFKVINKLINYYSNTFISIKSETTALSIYKQ
jgi:hypothetical protein